ncbi:hypothetical protein M9Y10_007295 [Tritrichomonas musculus]|uniref:AraC family transcriptional regulator n=1 Tax=Tritrichomonas musculus TaxID=1915356 RepID=A0ABR2J1S5_9EUKA
MSYSFKSVTIRTDNSEKGLAEIGMLWHDIISGKIPLDFLKKGSPVKGLSPISCYSEYESDEKGKYDLTIMCVETRFFIELEKKIGQGEYIKIDESGSDISECAKKAWSKVWEMKSKGEIKRAFTQDYESTVPSEYTKDGKAHCYLYIAVK